jgi:type II secretory pathway pseudopilin PulG
MALRSISSNRHSTHAAGFAFLWMLFAVALLALGLTVGTEVIRSSVQREKERELLFIGHQFRLAIQRYAETQDGGQRKYPPSLEELLRDSRRPGVKRHLRKLFVDPMTGKSEWGLIMLNGGVAGVHSLSDKPPIKIANFEPIDASLTGKTKYSEWIFTFPPDLLVKPTGAADTENKKNP